MRNSEIVARMFKITLLICGLSLAGCQSKSVNRAIDETNRTSSVADEQSQQRESTDAQNVIRAGYGIPTCHLDMPIESLGKSWHSPPEKELAEDVLSCPESGIEVDFEERRVRAIFFYYLSNRGMERFEGSTDKGVSASSSFGDVISAYGIPSNVFRLVSSELDEFPESTRMSINYAEMGIQFEFVNARLAHVTVRVPREDLNYDDMHTSEGNGLIYVGGNKKSDSTDEKRMLTEMLERNGK